MLSALLAVAVPAAPTPGSSLQVQILIVLTALTLLPALLMSLTPFLRITIVLHFLRQALGTQTAPSNQVLLGLALVMSLVIIQPTSNTILETAASPLMEGKIDYQVAWERAQVPLRGFLLKFCREKDMAVFLKASKLPRPASPEQVPFGVIAASYILSELRTGFQIGAMVFLPFLVIDLVVASLSLSLGMVQLPPVIVSAPLKILLFVAVDGWNLVIGSLLKSF